MRSRERAAIGEFWMLYGTSKNAQAGERSNQRFCDRLDAILTDLSNFD